MINEQILFFLNMILVSRKLIIIPKGYHGGKVIQIGRRRSQVLIPLMDSQWYYMFALWMHFGCIVINFINYFFLLERKKRIVGVYQSPFKEMVLIAINWYFQMWKDLGYFSYNLSHTQIKFLLHQLLSTKQSLKVCKLDEVCSLKLS